MLIPWITMTKAEMSTRSICLGGKGGRCVRQTILPSSCAVVMKSGNLNFLELFGPRQACKGTALSLPWRKHNSTRKRLFAPQIGLKEDTHKVLYWEHGFVWWWNWTFRKSRSEMPGNFCNEVLKKDGEVNLGRSCEKLRSITKSQGGQEYRTCNE